MAIWQHDPAIVQFSKDKQKVQYLWIGIGIVGEIGLESVSKPRQDLGDYRDAGR